MAEKMRMDKKVEDAIIESSRQLGRMNRILAAVARVLFGVKIKEIKNNEKEFTEIVKKRRGDVAKFL
ncbi:MAG: hypothetical protein V1676_00125 [Candidatus Diapherotrites archaeon]